MSNQFLKLRRSAVPGKIPETSSLEYGEIALNTYDGLAFMKKSGSNGEEIVTIGSTQGAFTGSFSGSFTGSLQGTASWAYNALTASTADNFYVRGNVTASNALVQGTITAQTLVVQTISSSVIYSSGSNKFGDELTDTQQFTGSVTITGSLNSPVITGSLFGTASWAQSALTASYFITSSVTSASFATSASYALSSSFAVTASYLEGYISPFPFTGSAQITGSVGVTGSVNISGSLGTLFTANVDTLVLTGSLITTGSIELTGSMNVLGGITSSLFGTSSWSQNALTASYFLTQSVTSASYALSSSYTQTASFAQLASTASYFITSSVTSASFASSASYSLTSSYSISSSYSVSGSNSDTASYALYALTASNALTASSADDFLVRGTLTAQTIVVQTITSSTDYVTGSTIFGSELSNTHQFTGSIYATGSIVQLDGGYFSGSGAGLSNIPASGIVGLNLSQIATGSVTASVNIDGTAFKIVSESIDILTLSSSGALNHSDQGSAIGIYSHAEGYANASSGDYSHAEGEFTQATGNYSHAEGLSTNATGINSHAEGYLAIASGSYSHAEGENTKAVGEASHAEGYFTLARGNYSHTEGDNTITLGSGSHAEGLGTVASGAYQHVQGQYNLGLSNQSAFIIGNGIDSANRSNLVFASGSTVQVTGSLEVTAGITGSLNGTASYANTASIADTASLAPAYTTTASFNNFTASYNTGSFTGSFNGNFTGSFSGSLNNLDGSPNHIPVFKTANTLVTSSIYQSSSFSIIINQDNNTSTAPEALFVWQPSTESFNVISGKGNLDNYLQLNIQNTNQGADASSDVVATANNGDENANYINMGINSENFSGFLGGPNDAYLFATGSNFHIGNLNPLTHLGFFVGGEDVSINNKLQLNPSNLHELTGSLNISSSLIVNEGITGSLFGTASQALSSSYAITASNAISASYAESSSYALTASYALFAQTASYAATASIATSSSYALSSSYAISSSFTLNAISSSYALSASYSVSSSQTDNANNAISASYATTASSADNFLVRGTLTAQTIVAQTITSSTEYITGSTQFGSLLSNTHQFTGSVTITGSLSVNNEPVILSSSYYPFSESIALRATNLEATASTLVIASASFATVSSSFASTSASLSTRVTTIENSYATTGSNIFIGDQTVTGSLFTSGSNTLIGSTTLTGSFLVSGSTTQIGNNTLLGNTTLSGSVVISGSANASANFTLQGHLRLDPGQDPGPNNYTASYLFTSASNTVTGYDLYYRQDGNLIKFKWIEGGISTGILYGGNISYSGSTIFVKPGSGIINNMNASTGSEINPIFTYVNWGPYTASAQYLTSSQNTYLYVDASGSIFQQTSFFNQTQYEQALPLGRVTHPNYVSITGYGSNVQTTYDSDTQQNDFIRAFGPLKVSGFTITPQTSSLSFGVGSGIAYNLGGFYTQDPNSPSHYESAGFATASIARAWRSGSGVYLDNNGGTFYTTVDPDYWDDGTGTLNIMNAGDWQIQRVFANPVTGRVVVYYGQNVYTNLLNALQYLSTDSFVEGEFTAKSLVFVGYLVLKGQTNSLTDTANNRIIDAGIFRNIAGGSSGGGAVAQTLEDLSDVIITTPTNYQALVYDGGNWINGTPLNATSATSASYATSASHANSSLLAQTASYVLNAISASFATTAATASYFITSSITSASYANFAETANTASYVVLAQSASYVQVAQTASYVLNAVSASYAFSASNAQTSSYALQAVSSSYALNTTSASYALSSSYAIDATNAINATNALTASSADNFTVRGTLTAQTIVAQTITSSVEYVTGSTIFGSLLSNTHQFTGSVTITGSLAVNGSNVVLTNQTSSMTVLSASYATTSSFALSAATASYFITSSITSASFATTASYAVSSSYAINSTSASYAISSSYSLNATTASYALNANSASFAESSSNFVVSTTLRLNGTLTDSARIIGTITGTNNLFNQSTGSFTSAFCKYYVVNGSNARSGEVMAAWAGTSIEYTDFSTVDIGSTAPVVISAAIVGGNVQINVDTGTSGWDVKGLVTYL